MDGRRWHEFPVVPVEERQTGEQIEPEKEPCQVSESEPIENSEQEAERLEIERLQAELTRTQEKVDSLQAALDSQSKQYALDKDGWERRLEEEEDRHEQTFHSEFQWRMRADDLLQRAIGAEQREQYIYKLLMNLFVHGFAQPNASTAFTSPLDQALGVLGLQWPCKFDVAKKAYHELAFRHHPDRNGGIDTEFMKVQTAWEHVRDEFTKAAVK